jgi:flagellar assembly factor FliW
MQLAGTRFGDIEFDDNRILSFPRGLIGFGDARRYVLLEPGGRAPIAWLQSLDVPALAFPVMDGSRLAPGYPDPPPTELAREAGLGHEDVAVLVVVAAQGGKGLSANLLAPLVVDQQVRIAAQVVLDPKRFSATTPMSPFAAQTKV